MLEALMRIDIKTIRSFMGIVECQGVTAAQQKLHRSPSVISGHLKYLEEMLGMTLCQRGCSGFILTREGEAVYQACLKFVEATSHFEHELYCIKQESAKTGGVIRISMADQLPSFFYEQLQVAMQDTYLYNPNIHFVLNVQSPEVMIDSLFTNQIDLGIGYFSSFYPSLDYRYAFNEKQVVCCGRSHPLFNQYEPVSSEQLEKDYAWIKRGYQISHTHTLQKIQPMSFKATAYHMEATAQLILTGCYLGYLPHDLAKHYVATQQMNIIDPDSSGYEVAIHWAYRPQMKPHVMLFMDTIQAKATDLTAI